ncbi:MAG: nuclear transport factor 2 family protein [bacterium]|nr:nuclear transport factor 2 family protein [bacterium]
MPAFPRDELSEMVDRWVAANDEAGSTGDWSKMSEFFTEDAIYSWNNGPKWEFVARGRQEIHDYAFGTEMSGLERWTYPYVRRLIDEEKGEFLGIWRQVAPVEDPDGVPYEIHGTGGSWFRYAGGFKWSWQRDFFDHANAGAVFGAMAKNGDLTREMQERMQKGSRMPGWTKRSEFDWFATLEDPDA